MTTLPTRNGTKAHTVSVTSDGLGSESGRVGGLEGIQRYMIS